MHSNAVLRVVGFLLLSLISALTQTTGPSLHATAPGVNGWFRLASDGAAGPEGPYRSFMVQASENLTSWVDLAKLLDPPVLYTDPGSGTRPKRFYRLLTDPLGFDDWKNQITLPTDAFSSPPEFLTFVKFAITTNEPTRVYFADSAAYEFHVDFLTNRVPGFAGFPPEQVNLVSQYNTNREVYFGTIIQPWSAVLPGGFAPAPEYGIQFVGRDPIAPSKVRELFDIVRSAVLSPPGAFAAYLPTFEQSASAEANRNYFEANGIPLRRADDYIRTETCYSLGWAIGRLVFVSAANIPAAYANGTLLPTDILLTDGIPAELPYVAGIISFAAATPNSHVAILAQSYNVPFLYVADPALRARISAAVNREVLLQITSPIAGQMNPCQTRFIAPDVPLDPTLKAELLALKQPPLLNLRRKERFGAYASPTTDLRPEDARYFGGKAANFGLLRRVLPTNSPVPSLAISIDLYDDFMDQAMPGGLTLRATISNRLAGLNYPADIGLLKVNLDAIRGIIRNQTQFTGVQQQAILAALAPFATNQNIRFRSSSNVEDSDYFSGAGLYDSFSGCSGDDLDSDNTGPSNCDSTEANERGVFRAIRRVYASFFNDNAYLERLRLRIPETDVGMGMLVHYSSPDALEMANGVATVQVRDQQDVTFWRAHLVTQSGAVSITNPNGNAVPEEIQADDSGPTSSVPLTLLKPSNLVPFGSNVMSWPNDYEDLARMLFRVANAYAMENGKPPVKLDLEYKKLQPGILDIKQVREVPALVNTQRIDPYLINQRSTFVTAQGSPADVTWIHRLKSRWTFETRNIQVNESNLVAGLFTNVTVEWISGDRILTNRLTDFSTMIFEVEKTFDLPTAVYQWSAISTVGPARFRLAANYNGVPVSPQAGPLVGLDDFGLLFTADYDHAVWNLPGYPQSSTADRTILRPQQTNSPIELPKALNYDQGGTGPTNVVITSRYFLGSNVAYSGDPPLLRFEETRIVGLTTQPIVLHGFFSQSWTAAHRQSIEWYLFEPHLEPGLDPETLRELEAKNIRLIHVEKRASDSTPFTYRLFTFPTHDAGPLP